MDDSANYDTSDPVDDSGPAAELEALAAKTHTPATVVDQLFKAECAELERDARIVAFIPALAHRRVKTALKNHAAGSRLSDLRGRADVRSRTQPRRGNQYPL